MSETRHAGLQRHSGTAAREQFTDRHKTVARLPTVAGLASETSSRHRKATGPLIHCIAAPL
jgi:hypothetical protein